MPLPERGSIFTRLETNKEYAARLRAMGLDVSEHDGQVWLDRIGDAYGAQRRIIEDASRATSRSPRADRAP